MIVVKKNMNQIKNLIKSGDSVVTIGFFDGFHKYHNDILQTTQELAQSKNMTSIVISFSHKISSFLKKQNDALIASEAKQNYLETNFKLDYYIELEVDEQLIETSPKDFLKWLKEDLKTIALVEGEDFCFGAQGVGTIKDLELEFDPQNVIIKKRVKSHSSSKIRSYIAKGKVHKANKMLGIPFSLYVKKTNSQDQQFAINFPNSKVKDGYYNVFLNNEVPGKIFIANNQVSVLDLNKMNDLAVEKIFLKKYLGIKNKTKQK
ncbi:hypothetical protein [Williamsoniiplasma somnilux]|nr:hypothetical protein [Williamsoniiplasma somnilux]